MMAGRGACEDRRRGGPATAGERPGAGSLRRRSACRRPLRGCRPAAGDLVRRPRRARDGHGGADRDVSAPVRRLGPVRRHGGARGGRRSCRGDRRRHPAQPALCADGHRPGSVASRRPAAPSGHRAGDDRLLVGCGEPRRRALRPAFHARRHRAFLSLLGRRHGDRSLRRGPDRRPRETRPRRALSRLLPLPAGGRRAAPGPAGAGRRSRQPRRPGADSVHARGRAGDRRLGRRRCSACIP